MSSFQRVVIFAACVTIWFIAGIDETLELNLADRLESAERHADRLPHDGGLGQDRVADSAWSEAFLKALRHPEHAAETADVLTDEHDRVVVVHQFVQRAVERFGQATRLGIDHEAKAFSSSCRAAATSASTATSHSSSTTPAATNVSRYFTTGSFAIAAASSSGSR